MGNFCPRTPRFVTGRQAERETSKQDNRLKVVQYYSPTCGHCQKAHPKIEELQRMFCSEVDVLKVPVDQNPKLADAAKIKYLPTVAVYRNGQRVAQTTGDQDMKTFVGMVKRAMRKVAKEEQ